MKEYNIPKNLSKYTKKTYLNSKEKINIICEAANNYSEQDHPMGRTFGMITFLIIKNDKLSKQYKISSLDSILSVISDIESSNNREYKSYFSGYLTTAIVMFSQGLKHQYNAVIYAYKDDLFRFAKLCDHIIEKSSTQRDTIEIFSQVYDIMKNKEESNAMLSVDDELLYAMLTIGN